MQSIQVTELHEKIKSGQAVCLIDVRTPAEFKGEHASVAVNIPLDILSKTGLEQAGMAGGNQPLYFICQGGGRSARAVEKITHEGLVELINVEGGTNAWIAAQLPTVRGEGVISLERQVRIIAGSLIFIGIVFGHFINNIFYLIPGLVGVGLVFSGVTNWCGMALMLAKMPWNR